MPDRDTRIFRAAANLAAAAVMALLLAGCAGTPPREAPPQPLPEPPGLTAADIIFDAETAAGNQDYETAISLLEELLTREKDNLEALRLLAKVYAAQGDKGKASDAWKNISALDPSDPDAAYEVGAILAREKEWNSLRAGMLSLESMGRADKRHHLLLGQAALELGLKQEAEKYLLLAGDLELAQSLLGKLYYEQGKLRQAEEIFTATLRHHPRNYTAHLHLGYIHYSRGNNQAALRHYQTAHKVNPDDPVACLSLAALHEKTKKTEQAIKYYQRAISLPGIPPDQRKKVFVTLAKLAVASRRFDDAYQAINRGLKEFPRSGGLFFYWGEGLLQQGRNTEAKQKFKRAAEDPAWKNPALTRFHSIRG
ncbi:MAG: tetratricopeptide repeat protein [Candidatus Krumholzibacteriota bacterium]|nr:tetratricopeptide repeat protein [Candidatus Krumholzibacteriota bacterium]